MPYRNAMKAMRRGSVYEHCHRPEKSAESEGFQNGAGIRRSGRVPDQKIIDSGSALKRAG